MLGKLLIVFCLALFVFTGCQATSEFYALNLAYGQGGHLGGAKVIITINGHRPKFFGENYSTVSAFSGTDMSYINDFVKEGQNTITLEIIPSENVSDEKKTEPFIFHLSIEKVKKGEMVDTGAQGNLFDYTVEVKPGEPAPKWQKTFVVKNEKK